MRSRLIGASMLAIFVAQAATARAQTVSTGASASPRGKSGLEEIVVTATKRSERLQRVPLAVQVLDSKTLAQQNVNNFQDFLKLVPSLTAQTQAPNTTSIYLRGVSSGDNANHSGPLPTVGSYLDEYPTTTIGGTLDVHAYDLARIEVLPGPQGTLFGASSEAGTVRMITNKPDASKFSAGYSVEGNTVAHGGQGDVTEGFVNVPLTDKIAVRLVAFQEHDAGYIDNVPGTYTQAPNDSNPSLPPYPGFTTDNAQFVKKNFNPADTYGGRLALKIDLDDSWTVSPMIMGQDLRYNGVFGYLPSVGDLKVQRFQPDTDRDRWAQAGLTVNGKVGNFDLTYAGSLFVRDVHQRIDYSDYTAAYAGYSQYFLGADGLPLANQLQFQDDKDHFNKVSNEIRLASPATDRLRFIVGAFQELQTHHILQDYEILGLSPTLSNPVRANTIWLTNQERRDTDYAAFTEISYDVLPNFTVTAGVRPYYYDNSLQGFYGFSAGIAALGYSSTGEGLDGSKCLPGQSFQGAPCVNLNKTVTGSGETHKVNFNYKIDANNLVYFTYSTGYRPGGVNRNGNYGPYTSDTLTNFEIGAKSQFFDRRLTIDAALYDEDWENFQFSFLGQNSLTIVENAPAANIKGAEIATIWRATDDLTLTSGLTVQDPILNSNFCGADATGKVIPTCADSAAQALAGSQLPYSPRVKASLTARYTFVVGGWDGHLQGTAAFQGHSPVALLTNDEKGINQVAALGTLPNYTTFDLSTGMERNNIALELFVKNLTDRRGQQNRYLPCTVGVCTNVYVVPIVPRTIGIRLSQKF